MGRTNLPPIPIPPRVLELLEDYPELVAEIRGVFDRYIERPNLVQPLDGALWLLEDTLDAFVSRAKGEADRAEASGDASAIAAATAKVRIMFQAFRKSDGLRDVGAIVAYFDKYEDAL